MICIVLYLFQCLESLGNCASAASAELADLLTGYDMEALLAAHDGVAALIDKDSPLGKAHPDADSAPSLATETPPTADHYADNNIKIIKIEKTNEPLGKYTYIIWTLCM